MHMYFALLSADIDYRTFHTLLLFSGNETSSSVNITLIDNDDTSVVNKTFYVLLMLNDPPANVKAGIINTTVVIVDDGEQDMF